MLRCACHTPQKVGSVFNMFFLSDTLNTDNLLDVDSDPMTSLSSSWFEIRNRSRYATPRGGHGVQFLRFALKAYCKMRACKNAMTFKKPKRYK